jgi:DNA mismatch repair ATPase MutS
MLYFIIALGIATAFYLFLSRSKANKHAAAINAVIENWGKPVDDYKNIDLIKPYHQYAKTDRSIADNIAVDIDLESVFNHTDRTNSKVGQQYLYHKLWSPEFDLDKLLQLDKLAQKLTDNESIRTDIQLELSRLKHRNAYYLHQLFTGTHTPFYNYGLSLYIRFAGFLWVGMLALTAIIHSQVLFITTLGLTFFNFYLHYSNKTNVLRYLHSLPQLYILMQVAKNLLKKTDTVNDTAVKASLTSTHSLNRSLKFVTFEDKLSNDPTDLSYAFWELFKMILLIEPAMFIASIKKATDCRTDIETLFKYVGEIDAAISIQSFRMGLPYYSKPELIINHYALHVDGLYHPLVSDCVANSIEVFDNQGVLITGSNMSGKTTFIRAMAINALLSQTIYTSCTHQYRAPLLQLFTSIRISDDMEEHKSYFQSEALSVLNIIKQSQSNTIKSLVIIDEIFRGTNTIERVAAAKAILSYFTANKSFVFVSTHDLELAELLGYEYAVYCFEEQVADTRLVFDYKIKPGILKNKNAIAIMAGLGYPESVIADACVISEQLRNKYDS